MVDQLNKQVVTTQDDSFGRNPRQFSALHQMKSKIRFAPMHARIEIFLDVRDRKQLEKILLHIKKIPGIFDIQRVYNA